MVVVFMNFSNLDYGLLFIFKVCAEVDSFSKASQILRVKQPAVSYSISKLENLLNTKLFERGNFGVRLTKAGIGIGYINEEVVRDEIGKGNLCIISSKTTADIYSVDVAIQNKNNNFVIKEFIRCLKGVLTEND